MNYRDFGKTGIKVSEVGFGSWAIGGNSHGISYGQVCDKESVNAIETALDLGCNFFDTADVYGWGHSEDLLGSTLKSRRDKVILATKVGSDFYQGYGYQSFSGDYIEFALDKSLSRLKTDYIDVYQLHNPPRAEIQSGDSKHFMEELKKEGKIRAWGLSVSTAEEAMMALDLVRPDSLQIPINLFSSDFISDVLPKAYELGCALIAREPLANGFLTGKYHLNDSFAYGDIRHSWPKDHINARVKAAKELEFLEIEGERTLSQAAIKWVLGFEEIAVAICGAKTDFQARENFSSSSVIEISETDLSIVSELQKNKFGL